MDSTVIEVNDAMFCKEHRQEVCDKCNYDGREENDAFYGFDVMDRGPLELPGHSTNKEGVIMCKKHSNATCDMCFNWKKQITRLRAAAKRAGKA